MPRKPSRPLPSPSSAEQPIAAPKPEVQDEDAGLPLRVIEDADTGHRFLVYTSKQGLEFDIRYDGDEPWFTQLQLAQMYGVTVPTINVHLKRFLADGELDEAVIREFQITAADGKTYKVKHYALDAAFYVGYRVNSREGLLFRRWATTALVQLATKAFVIDMRRLENPGTARDHFDELLDKVRHIRSSERRMWTRVLELASFCSDYGVLTKQDKANFFAAIQNAMQWATTHQTAAEVIFTRADRAQDNAGLVHVSGDLPTVDESKVAKNYYTEGEITALNLVTSLVLEFFESQAQQRRPTTLDQFLGKMRDLLRLDGRQVMAENKKGRVSMDEAQRKAAKEVRAYRERMRLAREAEGEQALRAIVEKAKGKRR